MFMYLRIFPWYFPAILDILQRIRIDPTAYILILQQRKGVFRLVSENQTHEAIRWSNMQEYIYGICGSFQTFGTNIGRVMLRGQQSASSATHFYTLKRIQSM